MVLHFQTKICQKLEDLKQVIKYFYEVSQLQTQFYYYILA